jgi:hypothetical protein
MLPHIARAIGILLMAENWSDFEFVEFVIFGAPIVVLKRAWVR